MNNSASIESRLRRHNMLKFVENAASTWAKYTGILICSDYTARNTIVI